MYIFAHLLLNLQIERRSLTVDTADQLADRNEGQDDQEHEGGCVEFGADAQASDEEEPEADCRCFLMLHLRDVVRFC